MKAFRKQFTCTIIFVMLVAGIGSAGFPDDNLVPEDGVFSLVPNDDPYQQTLREILLKEHRERVCQMVALPSFEREWAVYLVRDAVAPDQVIYKRVKKSLWNEMMRVIQQNAGSNSYSIGGPAQAAALVKVDKSVDRWSATISKESADLLCKVWSAMLARVKYPEKPNAGLDGVNYYMANREVGFGIRSGMTWSPHPGSKCATLVELAENLRNYAVAPPERRAIIEASIIMKAKALLESLDASAPKGESQAEVPPASGTR